MNKEQTRNFLFFLSPRFVDFDTYLPTAMELASVRPEWRIRFVIFHEQNYRAILANQTMMAGLGRCGSLHFLGSDGKAATGKIWARLKGLALISWWILHHGRPVLFSSKSFSNIPYVLFYALARLQGGNGYLLWKRRSPDEVHRIMFQVREPPEKQPISFLARMLGRDQDALIHYHDQQKETLDEAFAFGRIYDVPWLRIGLPHHFPVWRGFIDEQVNVERQRLAREGVLRDAEIYTLFAAKSGSGANLGLPGAIERTFKTIVTALTRLRPHAILLIRTHPQAMDEPYIAETVASLGPEKAHLSLAHPEVLLALSRRCITNNPTNVLFTGLHGKFIDCSEYPEFHFREHGEVSLAHGHGPLYINPLAGDFKDRLATALEDDSLFEAAELTEKRDRLHHNNPPRFEVLLNLLEGVFPFARPLWPSRKPEQGAEQ